MSETGSSKENKPGSNKVLEIGENISEKWDAKKNRATKLCPGGHFPHLQIVLQCLSSEEEKVRQRGVCGPGFVCKAPFLDSVKPGSHLL